jgi:predicted kinase
VIIICGVPASGKSFLACELAEVAGLPHISSDRIRKGLARIPQTQRAQAALYEAEWNARTYRQLARDASMQVRRKREAIVDATFRHRADRDIFKAEFGESAPLVFVECCAPDAVLARRAVRRERDRTEVSDADAAVVMRERTSWEPLDEVPVTRHVSLRTDRPLAEIVGDLVALLDRRLVAFLQRRSRRPRGV